MAKLMAVTSTADYCLCTSMLKDFAYKYAQTHALPMIKLHREY